MGVAGIEVNVNTISLLHVEEEVVIRIIKRVFSHNPQLQPQRLPIVESTSNVNFEWV